MSKQIVLRIVSLFGVAIPATASAQIAKVPSLGPAQDLLLNILTVTNEILIPFILGIGFLYFVWGMFLYFIWGGADDEKKAKGKSLVIHAVLGFVLIITFYGIINLIVDSTGLQGELLDNVPAVPEL